MENYAPRENRENYEKFLKDLKAIEKVTLEIALRSLNEGAWDDNAGRGPENEDLVERFQARVHNNRKAINRDKLDLELDQARWELEERLYESKIWVKNLSYLIHQTGEAHYTRGWVATNEEADIILYHLKRAEAITAKLDEGGTLVKVAFENLLPTWVGTIDKLLQTTLDITAECELGKERNDDPPRRVHQR